MKPSARFNSPPFNAACGLLVWMPVAAALLGPTPLRAQADSATLHATLADWSDRTWLLLLDRGAADGGRLNDRGVLQRFHPAIDGEYALDLVSGRPGLTEEYEWSRAVMGARYWGGSVNHYRMVAAGDFKARVPLGSGWTARARFSHEDSDVLKRSLLRLDVEKAWRNGIFGFFGSTIMAVKPEMDLTVGAGWRHERGELSVAVTALDAFNDVIFVGLEVWPGFADTAIDYRNVPVGARATGEWTLGAHLRVEASGGVQLPTGFVAFRQTATDEGFRQEERLAYAAGLLEYSISPRLRAGVTTSVVRARTDRTPLPASGPDADYELLERTMRVGAFVLADPLRFLRTHAWLVREFRPERREFRSGGGTNVDYEDRAWTGALVIEYRPRIGLRAHGAFEMDLRGVARGTGSQIPQRDPIGVPNTRLRFDFGWNFGGRFTLLAGYRIDLDRDKQFARGWFDGAHGRFVMYW